MLALAVELPHKVYPIEEEAALAEVEVLEDREGVVAPAVAWASEMQTSCRVLLDGEPQLLLLPSKAVQLIVLVKTILLPENTTNLLISITITTILILLLEAIISTGVGRGTGLRHRLEEI